MKYVIIALSLVCSQAVSDPLKYNAATVNHADDMKDVIGVNYEKGMNRVRKSGQFIFQEERLSKNEALIHLKVPEKEIICEILFSIDDKGKISDAAVFDSSCFN